MAAGAMCSIQFGGPVGATTDQGGGVEKEGEEHVGVEMGDAACCSTGVGVEDKVG